MENNKDDCIDNYFSDQSFFEKNISQNITENYTRCHNNIIFIENISEDDFILNDITFRNSVKIFNCRNFKIHIKGKFNNMLIHDCENLIVVLDEKLISGIDIIRCRNTTIIMDKRIGCRIDVGYSSNINLHTQFEKEGEICYLRVMHCIDLFLKGKPTGANFFNIFQHVF